MRTRVGLIVPRFRHSAVLRNRLKRRLRELSRTRLLTVDIPVDVVIRIRPDAYRASFADLATEVDRAVVQLVRWSAQAQSPSDRTTDPGPQIAPNDT
jgi:ribonuclease P protein component